MAISIIVEDGSIVVGANSFATLAEVQQFATDRGFTLPVDDEETKALMVRAADFILSLETQFMGVRVSASQEMPFPRSGVWLNDFSLGEDEIPAALKKAQARLVFDGVNVGDLTPTGTGREVIKEGVGPLSVEYNPGQGGSITPEFNAAMLLLQPLISTGVLGNLTACRG